MINEKHKLHMLVEERDKYKSERDTLIDDVVVLRAKIKRLERDKKRYDLLVKYIHDKNEITPNVDRYIRINNFVKKLEAGDFD